MLSGRWEALRRRKIVQWGIAYVATSWAVLQVLDYLAGTFEWPGHVARIATLAMATGLPIALVVAWYHGDRGQQRITVGEIAIIATLSLTGGGALWYYARAAASDVATRTPAASARLSIAVLPFLNLSPDPDNAFFADGIAEELLNILAGVDGLRVASRTSAFSFRDRDADVREIAAALGVSHVVEGSVRKQGAQARITAKLIDAANDVQLWSETYDRDLADIFVVQEEIARAISSALESRLGATQVSVTAPTQDLEAYELFLRGRVGFYRRGVALDTAIEHLQEAVRRDADFTDAWAYLGAAAWAATTYLHTRIDVSRARRISDEAVARALALDPEQPLALAARAVRQIDEGDVADGLATLRRAAAIESPEMTARTWYGQHLAMAGYSEEAMRVLEDANRRDPVVGITNGLLGLVYLAMGRDAEAEARVRRADELGWGIGIVGFAIELANRGETERALAIYRASYDSIQPGDTLHHRFKEAFYAALQDSARMDEFAELERRAGANASATYNIFVPGLYLALGDADRFFERIGEGYRGERAGIHWLRQAWQPSMNWLREDPRFLRLMREVGLVTLWEREGFPAGCRIDASGGVERLRCAR